MESESVQNSKQDKVLKGTLEITNDNNNKLLLNDKIDAFLDGLKSTPMNENEVVCLLKSCKDNFKLSHDTVNNSLPKVNTETKGIIDALRRIKSQSPNNRHNPIVQNLCENHFGNINASEEITTPQVENEVANMLADFNLNTSEEVTSPQEVNEVANVLVDFSSNSVNDHVVSQLNTPSLTYPSPTNGEEYTPQEFYEIGQRCGQRNHLYLIKFSISKNYIPFKKSTACKTLNLDKENVPNKWHRSLGRKRKNDVDEISTDVFNVLNSNVAMTKKDQETETTLKYNAKNTSEKTKKR